MTSPDKRNGFEDKPLRVVIENWLYNTRDVSVLIDATSELRKRLRKTFPRPLWAREGVGNVDRR